jgi:hypothetical protein
LLVVTRGVALKRMCIQAQISRLSSANEQRIVCPARCSFSFGPHTLS